MALRKAHGKMAGGGPRVEVLPPDELPPASPSFAERSDRGPNGRFLPGNTVQRGKLVKPGRLGGVDASSPAFRTFKRWGQRYAAHRRREIAAAHGGSISAGVGAIVESAALALAASRYLAQQAALEPNPDTFKRSADLGALARQNELAAWELAAREAQVRGANQGGSVEALRRKVLGA